MTAVLLAGGTGLVLVSITISQRMRVRGHLGWAYGLATLFAPPLGILMAAAVRDGGPSGSSSRVVGTLHAAQTVIVWTVGCLVTGACYLIAGAALYGTAVGPCYFPPGTEPALDPPRPSIFPIGRECAYRSLSSGGVTETFEPGWGPTLALLLSALLLAYVASCIFRSVRARGRGGWYYGVMTFAAPPLGLLLAATAPRRA